LILLSLIIKQLVEMGMLRLRRSCSRLFG